MCRCVETWYWWYCWWDGSKKGAEIIEIDIDGDNTDAEAIHDNNKIPGLDKNGVTASIVWDSLPDPEHIRQLPDSELIRQTVYGPDVTPFPLAYVGNALGTIWSNKIKTLTPGIWLMDEVMDFINGLLNLKCAEACLLQDPDQQSYFIFPSQFMNQLLNKFGEVGGGEYTFENVVRYNFTKKKTLIYLLSTKYLSPSIMRTPIGFLLW